MKTPLTPAQRALVQLVESILITACIAGLLSIEPVIAGTGPIDWQVAATTFGLAVFFSLAHSVAAYFKPSQPDLGVAIGAIADELENRSKANSVQQAQNSPTMTVARPAVSAYPNIPTNAQPVPTPIVAPNNVWGMAPLQGADVSAMNTASVPVQPKQ